MEEKNDFEERSFIFFYNEIAGRIEDWANEKGWRLTKESNQAQTLMLIVSELSEGLEGLRKDLMSDHIPDYKMIVEELADAVIRIMHYGKAFEYPVPEAVIDKMRFNKTRSYKHGGKKF